MCFAEMYAALTTHGHDIPIEEVLIWTYVTCSISDD